jgi:hypothetical protein
MGTRGREGKCAGSTWPQIPIHRLRVVQGGVATVLMAIILHERYNCHKSRDKRSAITQIEGPSHHRRFESIRQLTLKRNSSNLPKLFTEHREVRCETQLTH